MVVKALGTHYFEDLSLPINVCRVVRQDDISHEFDLTEIEHFHDFTELIFIIKGKGIQVIEQQEYIVSAGDIFALQGNQKHYFKDAKGVEIVNIMFSQKTEHNIISKNIQKIDGYNALFILESQYRANHYFKNRLHLDRSNLAKFEFIINSMIQEQENKQVGYKHLLKTKLEEIIILLSRQYTNLEATEAKSLVRISRVIDFLEKNFNKKIYINKLAEMAYMSPRNFQRIFQKAVGESPSIYIMQIRLQQARQLLRNTELNVAEIAFDCGFSDSNYFIKCFKKHYDSTPVQFRMRYKG